MFMNSENTQSNEDQTEIEVNDAGNTVSEALQNLRLEAEALGIKYTAASTEKSLGEKIKAAKAENLNLKPAELVAALEDSEGEGETGASKKVKTVSAEALKKQAAMRLHRVRITCNDRKISDRGQIMRSVGNSLVNVTKVIPLDVPVHVPSIMLKRLRKEKFISFKKVKKAGIEVAEPRELPTFVIEELPPLTLDELKSIAVKQQATAHLQ